MQTIKTDVLVIGGGGAAARAAIEAHRAGAAVLLTTKGKFSAIGTRGAGATAGAASPSSVFATPGWTGNLSERETQLRHMAAPDLDSAYKNIIQCGLGMADPALVKVLIEKAAATRSRLLSWGATFDELGVRSHGVSMMAALAIMIRKTDIVLRSSTMILRLLVRDNECAGAVAVDELTGELFAIKAGATVLATGGDANLFMVNLNPPDTTGDGYVLGYEAGAELMNLEFKQIFPCTVYPTGNMLTQPFPPHVKLTNSRGEEFLGNYLPFGASVGECLAQRNMHNPFSTRDTLSRFLDIAVLGELKANRGTAHSGIYLDRTDPRISPIPSLMKGYWIYKGIDFTRPVEIGICHHCSLGGLRINKKAETAVHRLFAAGEAAAGPHGADRMGGHMLLASQVFGAIAGRQAAAYRKRGRGPDIGESELKQFELEINALKNNRGTENPAQLKKKLQELAYFDLLVVRSGQKLEGFRKAVIDMQQSVLPHLAAANPGGLVDALELRNLLTLAELEAAACMERTESRGPHYRGDFPAQDNAQWLKNVVLRKSGDKPVVKTVSLHPEWQDHGDDKIGYWG
jgi:succinate dehydrogenase/fumarate reductase flavoprotein subunit